MKVMFVQSRVDGVQVNAYLKQYDASALPDPIIVVTDMEAEAMRFANLAEARECWSAVREPDPVRPDGKPNRPLTAYHVEIIEEGVVPLRIENKQ